MKSDGSDLYDCFFTLHSKRRRLTVGGRITVQLVSSLTRLDLTKKEIILYFECSETAESKLCKTGDQPYSDTSPNSEFSLLQAMRRLKFCNPKQ